MNESDELLADPCYFVIVAALMDTLDRVRGMRDHYVHQWRCLDFIRPDGEGAGVGDRAALADLLNMLRLEIGALRALEHRVLELLHVTTGTLPVQVGSNVWERVRASAPWALLAALDRDSLTIPDAGAIFLLHPEELRSRYPEGWPKLTEDQAREIAEDAETRMAVALAAATRRFHPRGTQHALSPASLRHSMRSLAEFHTDLRICGRVLSTARRSVEQWLQTLPPGYPRLPPSHLHDREFLFRIEREILRDAAQQVSRLAPDLRPQSSVGKSGPFPTPTVAFTDDVDSRVTVDRDRLAIVSPVYFQEAPRFLLSILHECAHGFLPPLAALAHEGAFAPWLDGPVGYTIARMRRVWAFQGREEPFYLAIQELIADCVAVALGGPHHLMCILLANIGTNPFAEAPSGGVVLDPIQRCRVLAAAIQQVWPDALRSSGPTCQMLALVQGFCDRFDRVVDEIRLRSLPGSDRAAAQARARADQQRRLEPPLIELAKELLTQLCSRGGADAWRARAHDDASRALCRSMYDELGLNDEPVPEVCLRPFDGAIEPGFFPRRNALNFLWAHWFATFLPALKEARGKHQLPTVRRDIHALVFYYLRAKSPGTEYFGRGEPVTLTYFDTSPPYAEPASDGGPHKPFDDDLKVPRTFHALGQFDYLSVVHPASGECRGDSTDFARFGVHRQPHYTRQQELHLLPSLGGERTVEGWLPCTPTRTTPIFSFLHRILFDMGKEIPVAKVDLQTVKEKLEKQGVEVRAFLRGFAWEELCLWVTPTRDVHHAIASVCDASAALNGARGNTTTLIRWTPLLDALRLCAPDLRSLVNLQAEGRPHFSGLRFILRVWLGQKRRPEKNEVQALVDAVNKELTPGQKQGTVYGPDCRPMLGFAELLGDEDYVGWLEVPTPADPAIPGAGETAELRREAVIALLLLRTLERIGRDLGAIEVSTVVTLTIAPGQPPAPDRAA